MAKSAECWMPCCCWAVVSEAFPWNKITAAAAVATAATKPPSEEAPRALPPHYGTAYSISLLLVITACRFGTEKGAGS